MSAVDIPDELPLRLCSEAERTGRTVASLVSEVLADHLDDRDDYELAVSRLSEGPPTVSLAEVERRLGLAD